MRILTLSLAAALAGCTAVPESELCDLNELIPTLGAFKFDPQTRELREVPVSPALVPCECDVHPFLESLPDHDPVADATASFTSGEPSFLGEPVLGGLWPVGFEEHDYALLDTTNLSVLPGLTEEVQCYEHTRLSLEARAYLERYNRELARLVSAR